MLLATGRYGDCMVLLRSLLEDTDLMTYFACYPEEAADWTERLSRAPVWSDEVYRQGIRKFRMTNIWKKVKERGIEPLGERDYSILSATVHASPWGTHFYGRALPGDPGRLHLSLAPVYDPAATFSVGLVLQGTYPRPIYAFLTACSAARFRHLIRVQSKHVRTTSSGIGSLRWTFTLGLELKWPMQKSAFHAARSHMMSLYAYASASVISTGRP